VVTGLGTINPIGNDVPSFWDNLKRGTNGVRRLRNFDPGDAAVQIGGEVDIPDLTEYGLGRKSVRRFDRFILFAHVAGTQALRDAGIDVEKAPHRYGSVIGSGEGGLTAHETNVPRIQDGGPDAAAPLYVVNAIPSSGTGFVAREWNLQGPNFAVSAACATSNHSISVASLLIKSGLADAMLAGGSEAVVTILGLGAFSAITALSERNDSPETASRPFDRDRDGFVLSEGAAALCLEDLEHARARGARIYAEITGYGLSCDAHDLVAPHPEADGAALAMRNALESAQLSVDDIDLINCHATSTPLGDVAECRGIHSVFGDLATRVPVHATKSMTGHLVGATSASEAIASILAITEGAVHPTTNQFERDPDIDLNIVRECADMDIRHVLSNSFGFAGQNSALVISRFDG
jgi:3-oxoacyl-[acyl-carrier-protein] synthase II